MVRDMVLLTHACVHVHTCPPIVCFTTMHVQQVDVNGPNTHAVFKFLKRELPLSEGGGGGQGEGRDLTWNFK